MTAAELRIVAEVDALLAGKSSADKAMFSSYNHVTSSYTRNATRWLNVDTSCFGVYFDGNFGVTMITPSVYLRCGHAQWVYADRGVSWPPYVRCVGIDGVVYQIATTGDEVRYDGYAGLPGDYQNDIVLGSLVSPMPPTVRPARMPPANYEDHLQSLDIPIIWIDKLLDAYIFQPAVWKEHASGQFIDPIWFIELNGSAPLYDEFKKHVPPNPPGAVGGDSGHAFSVLHRGRFTILGHLHGATNGESNAEYRVMIADAIEILTPGGPSFTEETFMSSYLNLPGASGNYATTPTDASLEIIGDFELDFHGSLATWPPPASTHLVSKLDLSVGAGYSMSVSTLGKITANLYDDTSAAVAATSSVAASFSSGVAFHVRCSVSIALSEVRFYTSPDGVVWTQLGTMVTISTNGAVGDSTQPLHVGARNATTNPVTGTCFSCTVRDGIGGTVVANPDFEAEPPGTTSFTDSTGKVWSVVGTATIEAVATCGYSRGRIVNA